MKKLIAAVSLAFVTVGVLAANPKATGPTVEQKRICRDSATIIDMMAEARDKGMNLKQARDQRIGFAEVKKMLENTGKPVDEATLIEASESLIDVVFITLRGTPKSMLVAEFFSSCLKDVSTPSK